MTTKVIWVKGFLSSGQRKYPLKRCASQGQLMLNRFTIENTFGNGTQTPQMLIRLEDTATISKITTSKAIVNPSFQLQFDEPMTMPTKKIYMLSDAATHDPLQVALTGITTHLFDMPHFL